ncbi:acyltransferase [Azospirillum canadense]|uniref:acyltransferase n=1 Tax=Azospirillum canadense TaxID=403962 RepID=UPI002227180C|nr:acyltransferase [Azospirillum canadense]MCW2240928.1 acetyltransferase-like isoleucine patch superfamily enzyme [Azospirillum canadense]
MLHDLKKLQAFLQRKKIKNFQRRLPFGDLLTDRWENAKECGFGEGTSCYDGVLILGDVKVGKNTWIGPGVVLDGTAGLIIGDHCDISAGVHIYTHNTVQRCITMGQRDMEKKPTTIGSGVYIGPNSVIEMGVTIGDSVIIGAMSLVNRNIPSGKKAWGCPARIVGEEINLEFEAGDEERVSFL